MALGAEVDLFWKLVVHLALTGLPAALAVLVVVRRGLRDVPLLLCVGLAASGATAMLAFWTFWADPLVGRATVFVLALGSVLGIALWRPHRLDRHLLGELPVPLALWAFGSLFVLSLGFLHGGFDQPLVVAARASRIRCPATTRSRSTSPTGTSTTATARCRPPSATGSPATGHRSRSATRWRNAPSAGIGRALHYQVLAVVVQQLWIVAMWALMVAARIRPLARGLAMIAVMVSDVAVVHGFFVWPKLIAATFVLAALAMVISEGWVRWRSSVWGVALFAALCALAMLAHGASAFALIPVLALAALRGLPSWRRLGFAGLVAIALLAPWTAYLHWVDPPGDRLVKWQLGGSLAIDDRGAVETIVDGYQAAGFDGARALNGPT